MILKDEGCVGGFRSRKEKGETLYLNYNRKNKK